VLFASTSDDQTQVVRQLVSASESHAFHIVHAGSGREVQQLCATGGCAALILDCTLADTDNETLLGRLRATGVVAPALLLTSGCDQSSGTGCDTSGDERLPRLEAFAGNTLVRALVAMLQRHQLSTELSAARDEAAHARATLAALAHALATPLGVVMGMTQLVLANGYGLDASGRACLEDVALGGARARELLDALAPVNAHLHAISPVDRGARPAQLTRLESARNIVLIADDDAATRRLISTTLASDLYSVLQAADGEEAWRLIRKHHPAVAILDWQMPVYSGLELTDVIKSDPQVWGMTVIMLTGRTAPADRAAGAQARADLYLTKPFSSEELLRAVEQALGIVH